MLYSLAFYCAMFLVYFGMIERVGDLYKYSFNQNFNKVSIHNPVSLKGTFFNKRNFQELKEYKNMFS